MASPQLSSGLPLGLAEPLTAQALSGAPLLLGSTYGH